MMSNESLREFAQKCDAFGWYAETDGATCATSLLSLRQELAKRDHADTFGVR